MSQLAQHIALIRASTQKPARRAPVRIRSAMTSRYDLSQEHPWLMMRAGLTDWVENEPVGEMNLDAQAMPRYATHQEETMYAGFGTTLEQLIAIPVARRTQAQVEEIYRLKYKRAYEGAEATKEKLLSQSDAERAARRLAFLESIGQGGGTESQRIKGQIDQAAASGDPEFKEVKEDVDKAESEGRDLLDVLAERKSSSKLPLIIGGVTVAAVVLMLMMRKKKK